MNAEYHRQVTTEVLGRVLSSDDLERVILANIGQDHVWSWLFHPERHYDNSRFAESEAYIRTERQRAVAAAQGGDRAAALEALGRLLHTRQDFYSHSNWIQRCVDEAGGLTNVTDELPICENPQGFSNLFTARAPLLPHVLYLIPGLGPFFKRLYLPVDFHEAMHLDDPSRGPLFPLSLIAARNHTRVEVEKFQAALVEVGAKDVMEQIFE